MYKCTKEEDFTKIEHIISISTRLLSNIPEEYENLAKVEEEEKEPEKIGCFSFLIEIRNFTEIFFIKKKTFQRRKKKRKRIKRGDKMKFA